MLEPAEKNRPVTLGVRIVLTFIIALSILVFAVYYVLSQNFQDLLTDYTINLMQSMVEQGVTTVEYELRSSQEEAAGLADSLIVPAEQNQNIAFPTEASQAEILRMVYIPVCGNSISSDGRQHNLYGREDITNAFNGNTTVYGPYFNEENEYVICYSAPVRENGKVTGVLSIEKDGYYFCSLIKNIRFADSGESYIINADGTDIAVSNMEHISWVNEQYNARLLLEKQEDSVTRSIMELEHKGLAGDTGTGTYYWDGSLCYLAYAPIPSVQWVLLAGVREEEISSMTQSVLYTSIADSPILNVCIVIFLILTATIVFWIVSSLKRNTEINKRLNTIANYDALTGCMNRNSYHDTLETLPAGKYRSLCCIYIDVNGLHEINNHLGHQAGDEMLKAVAEALWHFFPQSSVYRIGGDEFVVICQNQDKLDVYDKAEHARMSLKKQKYEIAIGIEWRDKNFDLNTIVKLAESTMQMDKQRYYRENGKERQMRVLDHELEQIITAKNDADTFLSVLAPEFKGVYFVNLCSDTIRHLYIPPYFEEILEEAGDIFSTALLLYAKRIVMPQYQQQFEKFCDYTYLEKLLNFGNAPEFIYQKTNGTWINLQILRFKTYTSRNKETLWIFSVIEQPE